MTEGLDHRPVTGRAEEREAEANKQQAGARTRVPTPRNAEKLMESMESSTITSQFVWTHGWSTNPEMDQEGDSVTFRSSGEW